MTDQAKTQMEAEAVTRLELLGLFPEVIWEFSEKGRVVVRSEKDGRLNYLTKSEQKMVNEFERKTGNLVYHLIKTEVKDLGTMYSFLYVSPYDTEWKLEESDIKMGRTLAYNPGTHKTLFIGIKNLAGGLVRTW